MRNYSRVFGAVVAIGVGCSLFGCPKPETAPPVSGGPATPSQSAAGPVSIAVIPKGTTNSFWQSVKAGADAAAADENKGGEKVKIVWQGPDIETDFTQQINLVNTQVTSGVNAIVLAATNAEALDKPCKDAMAKGIPVVTVDSGIKDPAGSVCYIATDNVKGGALAAQDLAKLIGDKGDVGILTFAKGSSSSDDREKGFLDEIKKHPGIHVVSNLSTDSDTTKAVNVTTNMVTSQPNIAGIFAANEPGGVGAAQALVTKHLDKKIKLVAYDASADEIRDLKGGIIQALIVQDPFQMGYKGVNIALQAIRKQPIAAKFIDSGVQVVHLDDLTKPETIKLLGLAK